MRYILKNILKYGALNLTLVSTICYFEINKIENNKTKY